MSREMHVTLTPMPIRGAEKCAEKDMQARLETLPPPGHKQATPDSEEQGAKSEDLSGQKAHDEMTQNTIHKNINVFTSSIIRRSTVRVSKRNVPYF